MQWSYLSILLWRLLNAGVGADRQESFVPEQDFKKLPENCLVWLIFLIVTFL